MREMGLLQVYCLNRKYGCPDKLQLKKLKVMRCLIIADPTYISSEPWPIYILTQSNEFTGVKIYQY